MISILREKKKTHKTATNQTRKITNEQKNPTNKQKANPTLVRFASVSCSVLCAYLMKQHYGFLQAKV